MPGAGDCRTPALAQVKQTREQMMFYTSQWKGERFPDGRPEGLPTIC